MAHNKQEFIKSDNFYLINQRYQRVCKVLSKYCKKKKMEPAQLRILYNDTLNDLRKYLDSHGVTFSPKPKKG